MPPRPMRSLALISISVVLAGCAGTKDAMLPQQGPTMHEIYEQHFQRLGAHATHELRKSLGTRPLMGDGASTLTPLAAAAEALEPTFTRLPNPTLVLYVFPHLSSDERSPVPGYVTTFPLYERVEYALPGEVEATP